MIMFRPLNQTNQMNLVDWEQQERMHFLSKLAYSVCGSLCEHFERSDRCLLSLNVSSAVLKWIVDLVFQVHKPAP